MLIHDYDMKALVEDLCKHINIGGMTVSVVVTDDYYMQKRNLTDPFHAEIKTDHLMIYLNGQHPENEFPITEHFTGWFYNLIYCLYYGMFNTILDDKTCYLDRLTKGILKLLPEGYLESFEVGAYNEG